jgi:N-acetylgalactosamine-6-sulfatase
MTWGDLHCQGHPYAQTPNLDRLASEGTRFTQHYATGVTCCPSRTGFMTGKFPATFAKYPASAGFGDRVTITELLKKQGYATAHFGKWHIGPVTENGTYGIDSIGAAEDEAGGKKKKTTIPQHPPGAATRICMIRRSASSSSTRTARFTSTSGTTFRTIP